MYQSCGLPASFMYTSLWHASLQLELTESYELPALFCILDCIMILACRIAAGGDKRFRQSRLGSDAADSFRQDDDSLEDKNDFAKFDEPTRIEGEGGDVDPDPGDRESVRD